MSKDGISERFRKCLLAKVCPLEMLKSHRKDAVSEKYQLFNDLIDLCDDHILCAQMIDLLDADGFTLKTDFYNHRKCTKRPQLDMFWKACLNITSNGAYEPFPTDGLDELLSRLDGYGTYKGVTVTFQHTEWFLTVDKYHPFASVWWTSVVNWNFNATMRLQAMIDRKDEDFRLVYWNVKWQKTLLRYYVIDAWRVTRPNSVMNWFENQNMQINF